MKIKCGTILAATIAVAAAENATLADETSPSKETERRVLAADAPIAKTIRELDDFPVSCEAVSVVEGREASLLPEGKNFKLVWHDEFDGDQLDETKWGYRTNFWGRTAHWFAKPEDNAVEVKDGLLHLKLVRRPDGQFVRIVHSLL